MFLHLLDYFKFLCGFFVNITCHFQSVVMLEFPDWPFCTAVEFAVDHKVMALVGQVVSVVFKGLLDFLNGWFVLASLGNGLESNNNFYFSLFGYFLVVLSNFFVLSVVFSCTINIALYFWSSILYCSISFSHNICYCIIGFFVFILSVFFSICLSVKISPLIA